jgi:small subunit ribosomal protein S17
MAEVNDKKIKQTLRGVVVSDKMNKTRVIEVERRLTHSLYHKGITKRSRIFVHDEKNETKVGDLIRAESVRPLSKNKAFRVIQVLERRVE